MREPGRYTAMALEFAIESRGRLVGYRSVTRPIPEQTGVSNHTTESHCLHDLAESAATDIYRVEGGADLPGRGMQNEQDL